MCNLFPEGELWGFSDRLVGHWYDAALCTHARACRQKEVAAAAAETFLFAQAVEGAVELSRRGLDYRTPAVAAPWAFPSSAAAAAASLLFLTALDRAVERAAAERTRLSLEEDARCQALHAVYAHLLGGKVWQRRLTRRLHLQKAVRILQAALRLGYDLQMEMERRCNYSMRWLTRHAQRVWLVGGLEAVRLLCVEGRALHARLLAELAVALSDDAFDTVTTTPAEEEEEEVDSLERALQSTARRLASMFGDDD
jgi:hypothetical protein